MAIRLKVGEVVAEFEDIGEASKVLRLIVQESIYHHHTSIKTRDACSICMSRMRIPKRRVPV
jgi:hypothetical protein